MGQPSATQLAGMAGLVAGVPPRLIHMLRKRYSQCSIQRRAWTGQTFFTNIRRDVASVSEPVLCGSFNRPRTTPRLAIPSTVSTGRCR